MHLKLKCNDDAMMTPKRRSSLLVILYVMKCNVDAMMTPKRRSFLLVILQ